MFSQTLKRGNGKNEIRQRNRRMEDERREYGTKKSGHEKTSPAGLSLPNQNRIIIINIIWQYSIRHAKHNEIQLTKNKMDLNNLKMKNHPPARIILIKLSLKKLFTEICAVNIVLDVYLLLLVLYTI